MITLSLKERDDIIEVLERYYYTLQKGYKKMIKLHPLDELLPVVDNMTEVGDILKNLKKL